jgi:DNA repair protein RecO (recombination protein O)
VNGVHGKNAAVKAAILQPMYILDLEVYHRSGRDINRLRNARVAVPYTSIPYDISKSSVVLFLAEILNKCLREEETNRELYHFIFHSLTFLDLSEKGVANFHLWFLLKLTAFLGILPNRENLKTSNYFDLKKAEFVSSEPAHPQFMDKRATEIFVRLFGLSFSNLPDLQLSGSDRHSLLQKIIEFYHIHFELLGELKSLRVLKEVFNQ